MTDALSESLTTLTTIRDYIRWGASRFNEAGLVFGHGTATAIDDACALVLHTIFQGYDIADAYLDAVLTYEERQKISAIFDRRVNDKIPSAYLTHEAIFAGLSFYVDERVLVPRSPIAEIIEAEFYPWVVQGEVSNILDLCTGSACIAIACAYAFPAAQVDAVELSKDAIAVAKINIETHHLTEQIDLLQSDLFLNLNNRKYDVIVSNPPYVALSEWRQLPKEYTAEPKMGFDGGQDGLDIVLKILATAEHHLTDKGILIVEVGSSAETLQQRFPDVPFYWLEFERGGDGVFLLTVAQIKEFNEVFQSAIANR
jgi:ribosomal protein L3 glutamine methyltransferase